MTACVSGDEPVYLLRSTMMMYFEDFHRSVDPEDNYNISGQDVADAKGDAVFLCTDKMMWTIGNYKYLSVFELSVLDTYAQYTNFPPPGNRGFGGDGFHIGRETPVGVGQHGGQCDDDADLWKSLGIWYSLPQGGQCINDV